MKKHWKTAVKLVITAAIFYLIFRKFDIKLAGLFNSIQWFPYIFAALFIRLILMPFISVNRWKLFLLHSGIEERFFTLTKISFLASFYGIVLPSSQGGDMMRMYLIEKKHGHIQQKITPSSSVLIERMIGFVLLALIGLISSILIPNYEHKEKIIILISTINLLVFLLIFILTNKWFYSIFSKLLSRINVLKSIMGFIEKTHFSMVTFPYKKVLLPSVFLILSLQFCTIFIVFLVFLSFGVDLPFYQHISFYPIICILSIVPIAISGLGLREGFFIYFYTLVGISPEIAVGVSLTNYAVQTLSSASVGGIIALFSRSKKE